MREPIFILSPPRSFSSLISSILGQHPELHAFPELQVFGQESLFDMISKNQVNLHRLAAPGAIRAIAEVHEHKQTNESCARAWQWIMKNRKMTPTSFFNYLRSRIDPVVAIEKSPLYSLKTETLRQIIRAYPNARYIHLTRSVVGNQKSLREYLASKDEILNRVKTLRFDAGSFARFYPSTVWYLSHHNILSVMPTINRDRYIRVKGEDILASPLKVLTQLADWLQIDASEGSIQAMLRPHESPYANVGPRIAQGGNDNKFMQQPVLRAKKISGGKILTYREDEDLTTSLVDMALFEHFPQVDHSEAKQIAIFADHLNHNITAMQSRLGY